MNVWTYADLMEGPAHECHGPQRQVGWIGHAAGVFYPWDQEPDATEEPGGYTPVYIDLEP